jgi:large subunit ribosomal protein L6
MLILSKKENKKHNILFFNSYLGNINLFFIDKTIKIPLNINIYIKKKIIFFKGPFGILSIKQKNLIIFKYNHQLILILPIKKNKKSILNLFYKLIIIKIKGIVKKFKLQLILKGIGFKINIENNILHLKIGFSHLIKIIIPNNIQIINQNNNLICSSNNFIALTQFIYKIRKIKKPEPYKGKGFLLKNEKILLKEGKKSKK